MSDIRFNNWKHQSGTGGVSQNSGGNVGIGSTLPSSKLDVGGDVKVTGIVTATSFVGSGANLTGIDATAIQTGTTKIQTSATLISNQISGSGIATVQAGGLDVTGIITATSFSGSGANLTGINTAFGSGTSVNTSGIITATSFSGSGVNLTGVLKNIVEDTSPQLGGLLDGNGQTANFTANNTGLGIPIGTDANEPSAGSYKGYIRYNDDDDEVYFSNGTVWKKINSIVVSLTSVTGTIYAGSGTNLTLAGTGFLSSGLVVNFVQSGDSINANVTVTPTSDTAATVAVPAAVYNNVTAGNVVTIKVTNSDSNTSGTRTLTASSLPTGGTITTYSSGGTNYRVHSFTSSSTFTNTIASLSVSYLIVAGGGGGGSNGDVGGGGGAGGLLQGTTTASVQGYTIVVGNGGTGGIGGQGGGGGSNGSQGGNSSAFSLTSIGGGGGGTRNSNGLSGGSGGGGGDAYTGRAGGSGTSGQGHAGGHSPNMDSNSGNDQGGGGGAGGAGNSYNPGSGLSISITGSAVEYARGGTGSNHPQARQAPANSGDGGRGNYHQSNNTGGSGIVIIRYAI